MNRSFSSAPKGQRKPHPFRLKTVKILESKKQIFKAYLTNVLSVVIRLSSILVFLYLGVDFLISIFESPHYLLSDMSHTLCPWHIWNVVNDLWVKTASWAKNQTTKLLVCRNNKPIFEMKISYYRMLFLSKTKHINLENGFVIQQHLLNAINGIKLHKTQKPQNCSCQDHSIF